MRDLLDPAKCVLLVLEGPVCRLFSPVARHELGAALVALVRTTHPDVPYLDPDDPYETLRQALADPALRRDGTAGEVADAVEDAELAAAPLAFPAPYADTLLHTLVATGRRPAVVTDVSEEAALRYLGGRHTGHLVAGHVHGRRGTAPLLLPDPSCVLRAIETAGVHPEDALLIGATPVAYAAATAVGVPFLGCAQGGAEQAELKAAGVGRLAPSLREVVRALDPGAHV